MKRRVRANALGLSEIVGSLMLVLIVVSAATAFSYFIASYQKQVQAQENAAHQKALESLHVITVRTQLNYSGGPGALLTLNFSVESLDVNPIHLTGLDIDNQAVRNYSVWALNLTTGTFQTIQVAALGVLDIGPNEQFNLAVDVSSGSASSSFYDPSFGLLSSSYVQTDLFTDLANDFRASFLPPSAIPLVTVDQTFNATTNTFVPVPILDGLNSIQPGTNDTIVSWSWSISPDGTVASGEEAEAVFATTGIEHTITLVVTNNVGLVGVGSINYFF